MATYKCPSCGKPFNGRRCRNCLYETFTEEIGHGLHTHRGEPLVIDSPVRRPIRRKNPFVWDKRTRTGKSKASWIGVVLVLVIALAEPVIGGLVNLLESAGNAVESVVSVQAQPEPEPWPDQALEQSQVALPTDGTVLLDQDGIRVVADWQDGDAFDGQIPIVLENNSDRTVWMTLEDLVVNGFSMQYGDVYVEAAPGQTAEGYFYLDETEVMDAGITQFREISFLLEGVDGDTYETLYTQDVILHPQCQEDYVQKVADGGTVLLDLGGVRVLYQGCIPDDSTPEDPSFGSLRLYLENNTENSLTIYVPEGSVNGKSADLFLWTELQPYGRAIARISLYDVYNLGFTSWSELEQATLSLEVTYQDGEPYLIDLAPVSFDLDEA